MSSFKIPSLGFHVPLGTLYNAQNDRFLPTQILGAQVSETAFTQTPSNSTAIDQDILISETFKKKIKFMRLPLELSASVLAGMVKPKASGRYLTDECETTEIPRRALRRSITGVHEKLDFSNAQVKECFAAHGESLRQATHVVAEISWGTECVITVSAKPTSPRSVPTQDIVDDCVKRLESTATNTGIQVDSRTEKSFDDHLNLVVYGDLLGDKNPLPAPFSTVLKFITSLPVYVGQMKGKGHPLTYTLLPVGLLGFFLPSPISCDVQVHQPSTESLISIVQLFDNFSRIQGRLDERQAYLQSRRAFVPGLHLAEMTKRKEDIISKFESFRTQYARTLYEVRCGNIGAQELSKLVSETANGDYFSDETSRVLDKFSTTLPFIDRATSSGAVYFGYNGKLFDPADLRSRHDAYIFHFNEKASQEPATWNGITSLVLTLLGENVQTFVGLVDHDALGQPLQTPFISRYRDGIVVVQDVWKQQELLANRSIVRFDRTKLYPVSDTKAVYRRPVKMPCAGPNCDPRLRHEWICLHCHSTVEYSPDRNFSCDCGQWFYAMSSFKCAAPTHGPGFVNFDKAKLYSTLQNLEPYEEINILILGESGVGKSTFINAFINYLYFQSLKEALEVEKLHFLVPFSFATQIPDEDDPQGRIIQKKISFGASSDEHDGSKGQSATQKTHVYAVTFGSTIVRLIDTPGIGDVRGAEQDKKNMADILSVLRGYTFVHGILVLLKPNNSRLGVMFKFCIKELLTHLHRSAAQNMAFGFTNTRGSNYQPGDTFKPLEVLLEEFKSVDIGLFKHTVYCFDSESFRYLAARKRNIVIGNQSDYDRSWEHSSNEARRLLTHFKSLQPHQVKSTMSLNETRNLIAQLTKPMAQIAQQIKVSIAINEDDIKELSTRKLSRRDLEKRLLVEKQTLRAEKVDEPRTVCSNSRCTDQESSGIGIGADGKEIMKTVYKTVCHNPCYLDKIEEGLVADPGLIECFCIIGEGPRKGFCQFCDHSWQEHLHIRYELKPETIQVTDAFIERELKQTADLITLKEQAIKNKKKVIKEFLQEHEAIKQAAGEFTLFLRKFSITPYNDATVEYLDFLIKEEKPKVQMGASPARLDELEKYRREHLEMVQVLNQNINLGRQQILDEAGVERLVLSLYNLKHFGNSLRQIREVVDNAGKASFRERPYRVGGFNIMSWANELVPRAIGTNQSRQTTQQRYSQPPSVPPTSSRMPPPQQTGHVQTLPHRASIQVPFEMDKAASTISYNPIVERKPESYRGSIQVPFEMDRAASTISYNPIVERKPESYRPERQGTRLLRGMKSWFKAPVS